VYLLVPGASEEMVAGRKEGDPLDVASGLAIAMVVTSTPPPDRLPPQPQQPPGAESVEQSEQLTW
jgi:hypothetical protein